MIKSVTVTNYLGESLKIEMSRPETSGFYIERIEGLGPSKANINVYEKATVDGASYSSAHVNARNIVMTLGFLFAHDAEEVRHKSYKYFPLKKKLKLLIETDKRICETYGYVESNEPDIFSQNEKTQISIICPDPYFYSAGENGIASTIFSGTEPVFEFPLSNDSLTDSLIEFGEVKNTTAQTVYYTGDAEVGVIIYIHALGNALDLTIYNTGTRETMIINGQILTGDDIIISTVKGEKSIQLLRDGVYTNILNRLDKRSKWFQLTKGDNIFAYKVFAGGENSLQFRVENKIAYEGV